MAGPRRAHSPHLVAEGSSGWEAATLSQVQAVILLSLGTREEEERFREIAIRKLGHPFNIRFTYRDEIPRDPSGKFEDFRSEVA